MRRQQAVGDADGAELGEWIVPLAAAESQPAFMLLLVGPTVSIGVEHFYSNIVEVTNLPAGQHEPMFSSSGNFFIEAPFLVSSHSVPPFVTPFTGDPAPANEVSRRCQGFPTSSCHRNVRHEQVFKKVG